MRKSKHMCTVPGCRTLVLSKGLCSSHYQKQRYRRLKEANITDWSSAARVKVDESVRLERAEKLREFFSKAQPKQPKQYPQNGQSRPPRRPDELYKTRLPHPEPIKNLDNTAPPVAKPELTYEESLERIRAAFSRTKGT